MEVLRSIKEFLSKIFTRRQAIKNTVIGLTPATVQGNAIVRSTRGRKIAGDNVQTDAALPISVQDTSRTAFNKAHEKAETAQGNYRGLRPN